MYGTYAAIGSIWFMNLSPTLESSYRWPKKNRNKAENNLMNAFSDWFGQRNALIRTEMPNEWKVWFQKFSTVVSRRWSTERRRSNARIVSLFDTKFSWEGGRLTKPHAFEKSPFTLIVFKRNPFNSPIPCYKQSHLKMENIKLWTFKVGIRRAQSERISYDTGLIWEAAKNEKWG